MMFFIILGAYICNHLVLGCDVNDKSNPKLPKHFAVDIDGTYRVLNDDVMNKNATAFGKAIEKGINVFFATGRTFQETQRLFNKSDFQKMHYNSLPGVYADGAVVYDEDGNLLSLKTLSHDVVDDVLTIVMKNCEKYKPIVFTNDDIYLLCDIGPELSEKFHKYVENAKSSYIKKESLRNKDVLFLVSRFADEILRNLSDDTINSFIHSPFAYGFYKFSPLNVNKAEGIKCLMKRYNTTIENCGCMGDNLNDLEMLSECPYSFAPNNAKDQTKQKAKYAMKEDYSEGAFAKVMEKLYGIIV
uniref:HAD superfamily hydrolase, putative n=1 Tax=Babesia bovis TaxID=5865 RepID=S6C9K8_BABBO|nr:HAD superfamily hydrolase, putative [Babesia bovis]